ncbi:MAG TPA: cysteine-rich CWC family protein [Terriglobia bacterium]|nr:cysteine-rich CWC family protein [Terriglobia bacterium]
MKLGSLVRFILSGGKRRIHCGSCGSEFGCGSGLGCWCSAVNISDVSRTKMRKQYRDCLCPECLSRFAAGASAPEAKSVDHPA